eukprot:576133-Prorocentrum_minimum.AAC.1
MTTGPWAPSPNRPREAATRAAAWASAQRRSSRAGMGGAMGGRGGGPRAGEWGALAFVLGTQALRPRYKT